ncbi:hypothetical protein OGZ51_12300 [Lactococcus lactis]|uniref:Uncharacterized protein n=1 Tax=Lactococcus lactis TaxID=1358 RepID=A0A9X4NIW1_9LACT|nr:hypothetical protein [Lactococcus lactis]MDG4984926.1 hypothetical protein [Lactococcus lactis]
MTYKKLIRLSFIFKLTALLLIIIALVLMALSGCNASYQVFLLPTAFLMIAGVIVEYLIDKIYGKALAKIKSELRGKE